jgi:PleD family two-component response regulator
MLQGQGFAPRAVRTRLELASLLRDSVALVAEAAHPELGTSALAELRRDPRFAQFPVFLLAGTNEAAAVTRGLEAGADDVFTPPLNEAVLTAKLKRLVQARGTK